MLRLIHKQKANVVGAIFIDDIDDGLPNKQVHVFGSNADPKTYVMDGYANKPKQPCYVPYSKPGDDALPGYIDLNETPRVRHSAATGKIAKMAQAGQIDVVTYTGPIVAPMITSAIIDDDTDNEITITGTGFTSLAPEPLLILITGEGGPLTLTEEDIIDGSGTISDTEIVIPLALVSGAVADDTSVQVVANALSSEVEALAAEGGIVGGGDGMGEDP